MYNNVYIYYYIYPYRHNMGYVTCNQFHRCLDYLGLSVSPAHMRLLEIKFGDQKGFNYLKFLDHLQPSEKLENKYQTRMTQLMTKKEQVYTVWIQNLRSTDFNAISLYTLDFRSRYTTRQCQCWRGANQDKNYSKIDERYHVVKLIIVSKASNVQCHLSLSLSLSPSEGVQTAYSCVGVHERLRQASKWSDFSHFFQESSGSLWIWTVTTRGACTGE